MPQVGTDGASVMHRLHAYLKGTFIADLVPGIDDAHQLERAMVHGLRSEPYIKKVLKATCAVIKAFRKSDLQQV